MLTGKQVASWTILLIPFVVWAAALISDYALDHCTPNNSTSGDSCSQTYSFFAPAIDLLNFIGEQDKFLVGIGTILVFVATFLLWRATRDLVRGAEDTARRQLRAYVSIEAAQIDGTNSPSPRLILHVHNRGRTPAHKVINKSNIDSFEVGKEDFNITDAPQPQGSMAPGQVRQLTKEIHPPHFDNLRAALISRQKTLFLYGELTYFDEFDMPHWTRYRLKMHVDDSGSGIDLY